MKNILVSYVVERQQISIDIDKLIECAMKDYESDSNKICLCGLCDRLCDNIDYYLQKTGEMENSDMLDEGAVEYLCDKIYYRVTELYSEKYPEFYEA